MWDLEENLAGEKQKRFLEFLKSMLCWDPEERWSAKDLLGHPWLTGEP